MAYGGEAMDITLPAAGDLSAGQYRFIAVDANGRGTFAVTAVTPVIGILQNKPSGQDQPARIRVAGISRIVCGAALNEADMLVPNLQGFGTAAAAGQVGVFVGAICLAATGASADIGDALVTRFLL